jgi:hypothetical protein
VKATTTKGHRDTVELVLENVVMMAMVAEVWEEQLKGKETEEREESNANSYGPTHGQE